MCIARNILLTTWFNLSLAAKSARPLVPTAGNLAEGTVILNRVHPVSEENFPKTEDNQVAAGLIQTHESRVPHYHVSKLRDTHKMFRTGAGFDDTGKTLVEIFSHEVEPTPAKTKPQSLLKRDSVAPSSNSLMDEGSIRMTNLKDSQYVGPLKVGSQGDILSVVYDTGSTNLWFASTLCTEGPCLRRRRYDPQSSSTFQEGDFDIHVTFGTGELFGVSGVDDVEMGGFKVKQQNFNMIQKEKGSIFQQLDFEGILGLAFPSMSAHGATPLFDQVMEQNLLKKNSFSFYFTKLPTDASAVLFGDVDNRLYQGSLISVPVNEEYYWRVGLKSLKIGDQVINGPNHVVFDTGTTFYTAPKSLLPTILALMPQVNCQMVRDGTADLPDMTFTLIGHNGEDVPLTAKPAEYYVSSGHDHKCDPAFMAIEVPSAHGPAYILGEAFMRSYFTSFHRGENQAVPEVKVARINPEAIDLVRGLKKVEGMSVNQQKLAAASLAESNTTVSQQEVPAACTKTASKSVSVDPPIPGIDSDQNTTGIHLRGLLPDARD